MTPVSNERVSEERLAQMLAWCDRVSPRAMRTIKSASGLSTLDNWYFQSLTPDTVRSILAELIRLRSQSPEPSSSEVRVKPWETRPQGDDALGPSEIEVHEGAWAVVLGTNAKPAGWIDTHALFAHQLYRDQILSPTVSQPIEAQPIHALPMPKYDFQGNEPTPSQPVTGEEVEWTEPPLTCPHIDAAIASGELSEEVAQELATIRDINSQLRYGTWTLKSRLSDYQALKAENARLTEQCRVSDLEGEHAFTLAVDDPGKNPPVLWKDRAEAAEARLSAVEGALEGLADAVRGSIDARKHTAIINALDEADRALTTITGGDDER